MGLGKPQAYVSAGENCPSPSGPRILRFSDMLGWNSHHSQSLRSCARSPPLLPRPKGEGKPWTTQNQVSAKRRRKRSARKGMHPPGMAGRTQFPVAALPHRDPVWIRCCHRVSSTSLCLWGRAESTLGGLAEPTGAVGNSGYARIREGRQAFRHRGSRKATEVEH